MSNAQILIVEDDGIIASDLRNRLKGFGYDVPAITASGENAIKKVAEHSIDLVLMDIVLKGEIDGIEAAGQIRTHFNIPVIYVTAYADDNLLKRAKVTEPYAYIIKPFEDRELHNAIEIALYKHRADTALKKAHDELELRVVERTVDLAKANEKLNKEIDAHNQAAEALRKSEDFLNRTGEMAKVGGWQLDLETKKVIWTKTTGRIHELPDDYMPDLDEAINFYHPDDRETVTESVNQAIESGKAYEFEARLITAKGRQRWVRAIGQPTIKAGKCVRLWGTFQDITERKRAEEALRNSEARFKNIFESTKNGVAVYKAINGGSDFIFVDFNAAGEKIDNVKRENLIGKSVRKAFPGIEDYGLWDVFKRVWETGVPEHHPLSMYKDKSIIGWRENYVYKLPSGEIVAIYSDETERMQAQEALKSLLESTVGKFGQDLFDFMAIELCQWIGCEIAIVGKLQEVSTVRALAMAVDGEINYTYTYDLAGTPCEKTATKGFCTYPEDLQSLFPDGKGLVDIRAAGYVGIPLLDTNGHPLGVMCAMSRSKMNLPIYAHEVLSVMAARISTEIQRQTAEQETIKILKQLQQTQKVDAIGTLAGGIAHDFNNILSSVIGYGEIALYDKLSEDSQARYSLEQVLKAAERAKNLVRQILTFSRQTEIEKQQVVLGTIIIEVLKLIKASLPATIEIQESIPLDLGLITADPTQMHQVMMNLCTNAAHAMQKNGGLLTINLSEVDLGPEGIDLFQGLKPGRYLKLTVSDTGIGMDQSTLDQVFDPFFTTKPKEEGTGMGLSVVHGIISNHGGHINIESRINTGTTAEILFPVVDLKETKYPEKTRFTPGGNEKILLVDDETSILESLGQLLKKLGYNVTQETSSVQAFELFHQSPDRFDLVITDQTMPGLTGDKLAQKMLGIRRDVPIILCTGFGYNLDHNTSKEIGIREIVFKPIIRSKMAQLIRRVLDA